VFWETGGKRQQPVVAVAVAAATHGNIHSYMREKMTESGIGEEIGKSTAAAAKEETRMREESIWHQACEQKVTGTGRKRRDWDERDERTCTGSLDPVSHCTRLCVGLLSGSVMPMPTCVHSECVCVLNRREKRETCIRDV
jgi:hypothetical protein